MAPGPGVNYVGGALGLLCRDLRLGLMLSEAAEAANRPIG
jgi:hypothetical protein